VAVVVVATSRGPSGPSGVEKMEKKRRSERGRNRIVETWPLIM